MKKLTFLIFLLLPLLARGALPPQKMAPASRPAPKGAVGGCTPAYALPNGAGDRTGNITVTTTSIVGNLFAANSPSALVDGLNSVNTAKPWFNARDLSSGAESIVLDYGSAVLNTEFTLYMSVDQDEGTWQIQGSSDNSSYTSIGGTFHWTTATQVITTVSGNTTSYRYYRLLGVSGTTSDNPFLRQIESKACPHS